MITVITRKPPRSLSDCELTYLERTPIDYGAAVAQHNAYEQFFRDNNCDVISLPAIESLADSVFVEDTAVVLNEIAIMMSPGAESRRPEVDLMAMELEKFRIVKRIEPPAFIDGGDVLTIGKSVFVGHSTRTNKDGIDALSQLITPFGYKVIPVAVDGVLHLKSACSALDGNTLLINPEFVDGSDFKGFKIINVGYGEPLAANTIRFKDRILTHFEPKMITAALLRREGYKINGLDTSEFQKAEGCLTCLSLIFNK